MKRRDTLPALSDAPQFLGKGFAFEPTLDRRWGRFETVEGVEDIKQAIKIIVGTAKGERVMRPDFGCGIHELTFEAVSSQLLADIKRVIKEALTRFEARIEVLYVEVRFDDQLNGKLDIEVAYQVRTTNQRDNFVFPFYIKQGA